jgi:hypothetical protein
MTNVSANQDRREHPRFPVRAYAQLDYSRTLWEVHLLDMSISGAKVALLGEHLLRRGDSVALTVDVKELGLSDTKHKVMHLRGTLVHLREHLLGVEYQPVTETDKQLLTLFLSQAE